jgi:trehalose utilization protein
VKHLRRLTGGLLLLAALFCGPVLAAEKVLIVADEFPAMEALAERLQAGAGVDCDLVRQTAIPAGIKNRPAVIVYIHQGIGEPAEVTFIDYAKSGGKLILLHHSISSGKRSNQYWFPFLGIKLPQGDLSQGGYHYYEGIEMELVNLAPDSYVTTHQVKYDRQVSYQRSDAGEPEVPYPGFELRDTEVYLNHVFTSPKHILLGFKAKDPKTGKVYMQDRAGWYERADKGWVFYFMAGHSRKDFDNPAYAQIVVNAITWKPRE